VHSPPFRFLLAEDTAKEGASEFVAIWEAYEDKPFIEKIERLAVAGGNEPDGFQPVALRVTLADGRSDTLLYTHDPASVYRVGDIEFQGSFGYLSERNGQLRAVHLVNGRTLARGDAGVHDATPVHAAKIVAVDLQASRVTLDRRLPADGSLDGMQMNIVSGGRHRTSYRIERVLPPGDVVQLALSSEIFCSKIDGFDAGAGAIQCELAPPTEVVRHFPPGYYDGALLTDASLKARYRVRSVDGQRIILDRAPQEGDFAALDAFGRQTVRIFDFGEGDDVAIPLSTFLRRRDDEAWEQRTTPGAQVRTSE
jgi:hypothetical protein